jgi:exonuclease III
MAIDQPQDTSTQGLYSQVGHQPSLFAEHTPQVPSSFEFPVMGANSNAQSETFTGPQPTRQQILKMFNLTTQTYLATLPGSDSLSEYQWKEIIMNTLSTKCKRTASLSFEIKTLSIDSHQVEVTIAILKMEVNYEDQIKSGISATSSAMMSVNNRQERLRFYISIPSVPLPQGVLPVQILSKCLQPEWACRHQVTCANHQDFQSLTTTFWYNKYPKNATHILSYRVTGQPILIVELQFKKETDLNIAINESRRNPIVMRGTGGVHSPRLKISRAPRNSLKAIELQAIRVLNQQSPPNQVNHQDNLQFNQNDSSQQAQEGLGNQLKSDNRELKFIMMLVSIYLITFGIIIKHPSTYITQSFILILEKIALIQHIVAPEGDLTKIGYINIQSIQSHDMAFKRHLLVEYIIENQYTIFAITEHWIPKFKYLKGWIRSSSLRSTHTIFSDHHFSQKLNTYKGKGTAIIMSLNLVPYIIDTFQIPGHFTGVHLNIQGKHTLITSIYMPSNDSTKSLALIKNIKQILKTLPESTSLILIGDFNSTITSIDHHNLITPRPSANKQFLDFLLTKKNLCDSYRFLHPDTQEYTYRYISRIDFIFISSSLTQYLHQSDIIPHIINPFNTPHNPLTLTIKLKLTRLELQYHINFHRTPKLLIDQLTETTIQTFSQKIHQELEINHNVHSSLLIAISVIPSRTPAKYVPKIYTKSHSPRFLKLQKLLIKLARIATTIKTNTSQTETINYKILTNEDYTLIEQGIQYWLTPHHNDIVTQPPSNNPQTNLTWLLEEIETYLTRASSKSMYSRIQEITSQSNQDIKGMITRLLQRQTEFRGVAFLSEEKLSTLTSQPSKIDKKLYSYFKELFQSDQPSSNIEFPESWKKYYQPVTKPSTDSSMLYGPITLDEIIALLNNTSNHSSPGPDQISWRLIKLIPLGHTFWTYLLGELNDIHTTGEMPVNWNKGITILLSKIEPFNGDINKLRPICLINTLRKLWTGIIDNRLKKYVEYNDLLKGTNFGFRKGLSTSNSLFLTKSIIDIADRRKDPLYLILLDIQKAYDSVPSKAIDLSLQRIGIQPQLIHAILSVNRNLSVKIQHYYGSTTPFKQTNGLPQGDKYSPILWLIFYDPLLQRLLEESTGFILESGLSISHLGFADDLKLLSSCPKDSQHQLEITSSFLDLFKMKANPEKTIVALNKYANPTDSTDFQLQTKTLTNQKKPDELIRILGVYLTLDCINKNTIDHAMKYFNTVLGQLYSQYAPGPLTTYIINMVVIPVLTYRLQVTYVPPTTISKMEGKIRRLIRHKYHLPPRTPTSLLYSNEGGIKLRSLESVLNQNLITDTLVHIRSSNITSRVLQFNISFFSTYAKLPETLIVCPVPYKLLKGILPATKRQIRKVPLAFHISNALYFESLQLRTMGEHLSPNINRLLPIDKYPTDFKNWIKPTTKTVNEICGLPLRSTLETYYSDQLTTNWADKNYRNNNFIGNLTFSAYIKSLGYQTVNNVPDTLLNQHGRIFNSLIQGIHHRQILPFNNLDLEHNRIESHNSSLEFKGTLPMINTTLLDDPIPDPSAPLRLLKEYKVPSGTQYNTIKVYTDGSLINQKSTNIPLIGTSAIFMHDYSHKWTENTKDTITNHGQHLPFIPIYSPSSTTAEVLAIQQAIIKTPLSIKHLTIYTDSTSAIASQLKFDHNNHQTTREILKIPNSLLHSINEAIAQEKFIEITYQHVKAHTNNQDIHSLLNDQADKVAKEHAFPPTLASRDYLIETIHNNPYNPYIPKEIAHNTAHSQLFHNGILIQQYPRKHIKNQFQILQSNYLYEKIRQNFAELYPNNPVISSSSIKQTLEFSTSRSNATHFLDATHIHEEKFRRNFILNKLPLADSMYSWNSTKKVYSPTPYCYLCFDINQTALHYENLQHLWTCTYTHQHYNNLHIETYKILKTRYKITSEHFLIKQIATILNITSPTCLSSLFRLAFFHEEDVLSIISPIALTFQGHQTKIIKALKNLIDSFMSAYYKLIWTTRCRRIHSGKDPPGQPFNSFQAATKRKSSRPYSLRPQKQPKLIPPPKVQEREQTLTDVDSPYSTIPTSKTARKRKVPSSTTSSYLFRPRKMPFISKNSPIPVPVSPKHSPISPRGSASYNLRPRKDQRTRSIEESDLFSDTSSQYSYSNLQNEHSTHKDILTIKTHIPTHFTSHNFPYSIYSHPQFNTTKNLEGTGGD